jgi:hypothetical protein
VRGRLACLVAVVGCGGGVDAPDAGIDATGPVEVVVTVQDHPPTLVVGYQDGSGVWSMPERRGNSYAFVVESDRFGFVTACSGTERNVYVYHALVAEQTTLNVRTHPSCRDPANMRTGTIAAAPQPGAMSLGLATTSFAMDGIYSIVPVVGVTDWLIVARTPQTDGYTVAALKIVRGVDVAAGATMQNEDLSTGTLTPAAHVATLTGVVGGETPSVATAYMLRGSLAVGATQDTTEPYAISPLGATDVMPGDLTRIEGAASTATTLRRAFTFHATPADTALDLPPVLGGVNVGNATIAGDPYIRLQTTWPAIANTDVYVLQFNQGMVRWIVFFSAGLGATSYTLPRLDALAGWDPMFGLVGAMPISWTADSRESSAPFDLAHLEGTDGESWRITNRTGSYTPP